jgi:glucose/mannose-6-phosphate isomerase
MGGSGIGGDLLRAILYEEAAVPAVSVKDYRIPGFVGPDTLAFVCSYSGNTEETLTAYDNAVNRGAACLVITSGGELLKRARGREHPVIQIPSGLPQRAALPYLFIPMLVTLARLGITRAVDAELHEATQVLREVGAEHTQGGTGEAKRLAEALLHRIAVIYSASPFLEPVAQRWKDQINENAKTFAVWNTFPELNHNETVGWGMDDALARTLAVIVLRDPHESSQLARRVTITRELAFGKAAGVYEVVPRGNRKLAQLLSGMMIGDLTSWHLAMLRGVDPTPVSVIEEVKQRLARSG